jgi:hypothetical protein
VGSAEWQGGAGGSERPFAGADAEIEHEEEEGVREGAARMSGRGGVFNATATVVRWRAVFVHQVCSCVRLICWIVDARRAAIAAMASNKPSSTDPSAKHATDNSAKHATDNSAKHSDRSGDSAPARRAPTPKGLPRPSRPPDPSARVGRGDINDSGSRVGHVFTGEGQRVHFFARACVARPAHSPQPIARPAHHTPSVSPPGRAPAVVRVMRVIRAGLCGPTRSRHVNDDRGSARGVRIQAPHLHCQSLSVRARRPRCPAGVNRFFVVVMSSARRPQPATFSATFSAPRALCGPGLPVTLLG